MGRTDRIAVFGPRPYTDAVAHLRVADHCNPVKFLTPGRPPVFQPIFIVDSVINMSFLMIMIAILHEVLMMVILPMLPPLISED